MSVATDRGMSSRPLGSWQLSRKRPSLLKNPSGAGDWAGDVAGHTLRRGGTSADLGREPRAGGLVRHRPAFFNRLTHFRVSK